ncbi:MAG: hypothetical protein K6G90_01970 [Clostridia bacterium]|nr:hypothetical protein [Clostridia bacterium]
MTEKRIPIDTAATMFASLHHGEASRVYRLTAELKEDIDPEALKTAVGLVAPRFPMLMRRIHKGFFATTLDYDDNIKVLPENEEPSKAQWLSKLGGPDIRVLYYKTRIAIELSYVLTDANALMEFLKAVVAEYLILKGADEADFPEVKLPGRNMEPDESDNAFRTYYRKHGDKTESPLRGKTYGTELTPGCDTITVTGGLVKTSELKALSKPLGLTVTEYLACLLIYSVIKTAPAPVTDVVRINIPINLRKIFPSGTLRNFVSEIPIGFEPDGRTDVTVREISEVIRGQIKAGKTREKMQAFINRSYSLANNPAVRAVPLSIMNPVLRKMQMRSHVERITVNLTNIGDITLPPAMADEVALLEFINGSTAVYGQPKACSAVGFNGYVHISFSNTVNDPSIERELFRELVKNGCGVKITTSRADCIADAPGTDDKFCPDGGVYLHPDAVRCPLCGGTAETAGTPFDGPAAAGYLKL